MDMKLDRRVYKALKMKQRQLRSQLHLVEHTLAKYEHARPIPRRRRRLQRAEMPELDSGLRTKVRRHVR